MSRVSKGEWISGNIFIRPNLLENIGDKVDGHQHNFDHTTIIFTGAIHIRARYLFRQFTCTSCGKTWETQRSTTTSCPACNATSGFNKISEREQLIAERDFHAPSHCLIKADVEHEITAIESGTEFWCVYSHLTPQASVSQDYTGWDKAYY